MLFCGFKRIAVLVVSIGALMGAAVSISAPEIVETRRVSLQQVVTLSDIPAGAGVVRLWVPIPSDSTWQRVLDRRVTEAPKGWRIVPQGEGRGDVIYAEIQHPTSSSISIGVECVVETRGVHFDLKDGTGRHALQPELFEADLDRGAPLMESTSEIQSLADAACGDETDPAREMMLLQQAVAASADHYSKDKSKPTCGRGAAEDCLNHGGGCCTDLHSLFIAMARARNLPARIQYGYRLVNEKEGGLYDPGYRCWVECFVPGAGWVPTDVVASDNSNADNPYQWNSLSAERIWLWRGRSFELNPKNASGRVDTMLCGWAEIDGAPVDVLPGADGSPSKLTRKVQFTILSSEKSQGSARLPQ